MGNIVTKSMNLNNYPNSKEIVKRYSNSACSFEDLFHSLLKDKDCMKVRHEVLNGINALKAKFYLYDGIKEFTFYENGGFNGFGNHKGKWYKHISKEELLHNSSLREWTDSYNKSVTSFAPYYFENAEMKCGKDVLYFGRDSQTSLLILEIINKFKLYEIPFELWYERLGIDISKKKTNKFFTWSDLYNYLVEYANSRNIAIVGERMFCANNKKRYQALIKMYCAKANNEQGKFKKFRRIYNEEFAPLLNRLYNPQIVRKDSLAYKIYRELEQGNWCTDLLVNSHKEMNIKGFNKRQLEMYKYAKLKNVIFSSSDNELKRDFFNSYRKINSIKMWQLKIKNEFYSEVIENNVELNKIAEFKKTSEIKRNHDYFNHSLNIFNSVCKTSNRPFFMRTRKGKLMRYESYEKYENARKYFKTAC